MVSTWGEPRSSTTHQHLQNVLRKLGHGKRRHSKRGPLYVLRKSVSCYSAWRENHARRSSLLPLHFDCTLRYKLSDACTEKSKHLCHKRLLHCLLSHPNLSSYPAIKRLITGRGKLHNNCRRCFVLLWESVQQRQQSCFVIEACSQIMRFNGAEEASTLPKSDRTVEARNNDTIVAACLTKAHLSSPASTV